MQEPNDLQRWILAVGAPLNKRNGRRLDRLGGEGRPTISWEASSVLRKGWSVRTGADATRALTWLLDGGGHRAEYEKEGRGTARSFAGWDAERASNVAGWAYAAYLIDLETAWTWQRRAAALARESFASWAELGRSYLDGLRTWCEGDRATLDPTEQAVAWLLADPSSPWVTLPFGVTLGDVPAPDLSPREIVVGEGEARTLSDAIRLAGPDGRVIVPAGNYRETIAPEHSIELVGRGEVVLESAGVPCVRIEKTLGILLRGLTIRSERTADDKSLNTVRVNRGYARIEGCDLSATHDGVQIATWGAAHVVDSQVHDCGSNGLHLLSGQLIAERCTIVRSKKFGIELAGEAGALVEDCKIDGHVYAGVLAREKVRAVVRRTTLDGNGGAASLVAMGASDLVVEDVSISGSRGGGVFFHETAGGAVTKASIRGCALAALDVATVEPIQAEAILAQGNTTSSVIVRPDGRLLLLGAKLEDSPQGHVWVMKDGVLAMSDCEITRGALGLWVQGAAIVHACRLEAQSGPAIDAQPGGRVEIATSNIDGATGDGVLVGEEADVTLDACSIANVGGAGVNVKASGRAALVGVTTSACAGGEVVGEATRSASEVPEAERAAHALDAFRRAVRSRLPSS